MIAEEGAEAFRELLDCFLGDLDWDYRTKKSPKESLEQMNSTLEHVFGNIEDVPCRECEDVCEQLEAQARDALYGVEDDVSEDMGFAIVGNPQGGKVRMVEAVENRAYISIGDGMEISAQIVVWPSKDGYGIKIENLLFSRVEGGEFL